MKKFDRKNPPVGLSHHFDPPAGFTGCFGWLCGYSADAAFLDGAAERFMALTAGQRSHVGRIGLALMLDPHHPQISPAEVPGVLHLPFRHAGARPFKLMHAKVALLGFSHDEDPDRWMLRLVVSTGNWTRETAESSIDLAWRTDLDRDSLDDRSDATAMSRADLKAAWNLFSWLRGYYDDRALGVIPEGREDTETRQAASRLSKWVAKAAYRAPASPSRFFDNRKKPLIKQLPELILKFSKPSARNWLCFGSGFYESAAPASAPAVPAVLEQIVSVLQGEDGGTRLLTSRPDVDVFVNPIACQAVATSLDAIGKRGWVVRPAGRPDFFPSGERNLHAKFIFSAFHTEGSENCASAWLYLGSGNLTPAGFIHATHPDRGNLEAGVFIDLPGMTWELLQHYLPVQWKSDLHGTDSQVSAGGEMPEHDGCFLAAPVSCLLGTEEDGGIVLRALEEASEPFDLLDSFGNPCTSDAAGGFAWPDAYPRQVAMRWRVKDVAHTCMVPVLDRYGRASAGALRELDVDEAWSQLASFPMAPTDDETDTDGAAGAAGNGPGPGMRQATPAARYPIRKFMELVERIAEKQTALHRTDWPAWCNRLEQTLTQAASTVDGFQLRDMGINPLSPLWHKPFRPDFAEDGASPEGARYESALARIEDAWKVSDLSKLGEMA